MSGKVKVIRLKLGSGYLTYDLRTQKYNVNYLLGKTNQPIKFKECEQQ